LGEFGVVHSSVLRPQTGQESVACDIERLPLLPRGGELSYKGLCQRSVSVGDDQLLDERAHKSVEIIPLLLGVLGRISLRLRAFGAAGVTENGSEMLSARLVSGEGE
jgi:hypothetical protein